jgi:hypothetical protein
MPDFRVIATCPSCGADLEYVTGSAPYAWERACVVGCTECPFQGVLRVTLTNVAGAAGTLRHGGDPTKAAQCGTDSGYHRHIKQLHEPPCDDCREAHRKYELKRQERKRRELVPA